MHVAVRKNELERIERENAIMAKKLYNAEPSMCTTRQMMNDFHENKQLSANIAKFKRRRVTGLGTEGQRNGGNTGVKPL